MKTSYSIGLEEQLTLRLETEIRRELDDIIIKMQRIALEFKIEQVKERSPFKNVLVVATETTSSLEVIKNYIRYQVGRQQSSKIWKLERTDNGKKQIFADAVVLQINELANNFQKIIDSINKSLDEEIDLLLVEEIRSLSDDKIDSILSKDIEPELKKKLELLKQDSAKIESMNLIKKYIQDNEDGSTRRKNLEALKKHLQASEQNVRQSVHLNLARLYLGYLSREHTALLGNKKDSKE
ncbi:hypothetical protein IQ269_17370 [Tychonema sp. LEGE 07199]|uniref:hypothetical protein n=1 Tax=unclassified Tychonema TaxID=2642144 RepID=UPI00187DDB45|nr:MULTISPECIES: hypothetical protein [unclassified Tychonema]MBE9122520.1 hypothetical protein [Tychonema sp. LEGE 07199]MBE9134518.1 hypothetical protein [Tychonema sp. LEGE 07196]